MAEYPICYETIGCVAMVTGPRASAVTRHTAERTSDRLLHLGVDVTRFSAASIPDIRRVVSDAIADDFDSIVVVGDDSVMHEATQVAALTSIPIGFVPTVRSSDVAIQFRLSGVPETAAETIYEGFTTVTDLGKVIDSTGAERFFLTGAVVGLESMAVSEGFSTRLPGGWVRGKARLLKEFCSMKPDTVRIEFSGLDEVPYLDEDARATRVARDGQGLIGGERNLVLDRRVNLVAFANTRYQSGMRMCPRADHHDGHLDVTVIEEANAFRVMQALRDFHGMGQHVDYDFCSSYRCEKARVSVPASSTFPAITVDSAQSVLLPVTVECVEAAARIIVPAP